jgi:hypothetical protein
MDFKKIITRFIPVFAIALFVCMGVTLLWSLIFHGLAVIDWGTSFRFAMIFGIIFPIIDSKKRMKCEK